MNDKPRQIIGRAEPVSLPEWDIESVLARIDTGAKTTSIWASDIKEVDGTLRFCLFGPGSPLYTGEHVITTGYSKRVIANSTGHVQERYVVRTRLILGGRKIRASITLANRSTQVYPVLVGRNVLAKKFIVDVTLGTTDRKGEQVRHEILQNGKEEK